MDAEVSDLDHVAIEVSDIDAAIDFYHGHLGLSLRDRDAFERDELPFVSAVAGGRHLHLFPTDREIEVGSDHVCLLIRTGETDTRTVAEEYVEGLRESGVPVEPDEPRERLGAYGRDWAAYVRDPDGRLVELKFH